MILILFLGIAPAFAATTNEYWLTASPTTGNQGTRANPYNCSSRALFDQRMNQMPRNCIVHLLPGTYRTAGAAIWLVKSGQQIIGAGIDQTIIQFTHENYQNKNPQNVVVTSEWGRDILVSDLTVDCNYQGGNIQNKGVNLVGSDIVIRRVKTINGAGFGPGAESFQIAIGSAKNQSAANSKGNVIENCEVSSFRGGNCSALSMAGASPYSFAGTIRNNRVILAGPGAGVNLYAVTDMLVQSNYLEGVGFYGDSGNAANVVVANNTFKNVYEAVSLHNNVRKNFYFIGNVIDLKSAPGAAAFRFGADGIYKNMVIWGNVARFNNNQGTFGCTISARNVDGLMVVSNFFFRGFVSDVVSPTVKNATFKDNYDLLGRPWNNFGQ